MINGSKISIHRFIGTTLLLYFFLKKTPFYLLLLPTVKPWGILGLALYKY